MSKAHKSFSKFQYEQALKHKETKLVAITVRDPETMEAVTLSGPLPTSTALGLLTSFIDNRAK